MGILETIKKDETPQQKKQVEGFVWVTMLIKYGLDGNAVVIRSFSRPAKDSYIKKYVAPKKAESKIDIKKSGDKKRLF